MKFSDRFSFTFIPFNIYVDGSDDIAAHVKTESAHQPGKDEEWLYKEEHVVDQMMTGDTLVPRDNVGRGSIAAFASQPRTTTRCSPEHSPPHCSLPHTPLHVTPHIGWAALPSGAGRSDLPECAEHLQQCLLGRPGLRLEDRHEPPRHRTR